MRATELVSALLSCLFCFAAAGQQASPRQPYDASIAGAVADIDDAGIPAVLIAAQGPAPEDHLTSVATADGTFLLTHLRPAVPYRLLISAPGFASWSSPADIVLQPGQRLDLDPIHLLVSTVETSITAVQPEELALEQVKNEESQRLFGVIPNFYVVYDKEFVPLPPRLKFELAARSATDVVSIAGSAFLAGINQASAGKPHYVQGAKGYGERFGAAYAGTVADIMIGGAILPSLLHQDPRYFYQGTGTNKSRAWHAISAPFVTKGDNGRTQFNASSIAGDLAAGGLANAYYPRQDRGVSLLLGSFALSSGGRIANALAEEFILRHVTTHAKKQP